MNNMEVRRSFLPFGTFPDLMRAAGDKRIFRGKLTETLARWTVTDGPKVDAIRTCTPGICRFRRGETVLDRIEPDTVEKS